MKSKCIWVKIICMSLFLLIIENIFINLENSTLSILVMVFIIAIPAGYNIHFVSFLFLHLARTAYFPYVYKVLSLLVYWVSEPLLILIITLLPHFHAFLFPFQLVHLVLRVLGKQIQVFLDFIFISRFIRVNCRFYIQQKALFF